MMMLPCIADLNHQGPESGPGAFQLTLWGVQYLNVVGLWAVAMA